jgi:integrase/recombinase XerD
MRGTRFYDRRDEAALRLLIDTGARASEVVGMAVADFDLRASTATLLGKGDRFRSVPFGPQTARALDRYVRARRQHRHSASPQLWIGERGPWTYDSLADALGVRAEAAKVDGLHLPTCCGTRSRTAGSPLAARRPV